MSLVAEQHEFYRRRIPEGFNRTLDAQRRLAESANDPCQTRMLEEMQAVDSAIRVRVHEGETLHVHDLVIECGRMEAREGGDRSPFLTLDHALEDLPRLRTRCGDSILGFLGALAGLGEDMRLTARRVRSLRALSGGLVLELRGEEGFSIEAHFGPGEPAPATRNAIRLEPEVFEGLRDGRIDAQTAFLGGEVEVEGSLKLAIRLALALLSRD